ncbi:MAG: polysaccharide deacetylase family protein [Lysobacterales bacterium]|jgi:peptidoglycan/xylan/chitin deacetylase (PgdA/CDA1 family)
MCVITLLLLYSLALPPVRADDSAVVFMYHRFDEQQHPSTNIRVDQFRMQMEYLQKAGFQVIPLAELLEFLGGERQALPPKSVIITVDDAYRSVFEIAFPLLSDHGYPFTVFVASDPVDQGLSDYMSWQQIRTMADRGVSFANHGAAHISMVERLQGESEDAWLGRITADVEQGMRRLEEELPDTRQLLRGVFAYPYGEYDTKSARRIMQLGYIAFGQQSGAIGRGSDRRALPRYPMNEQYAGMEGFRTKAASGPLPVTRVEPWDPVTTNRLPEIVLSLEASDGRLEELACFVGGQGRVQVRWLEQDKRLAVAPREALGKGRHRVNCTAPTISGNYLWFSHQWIVR